MAEVLLKREQTGLGDMAWKPGDIVDIREDGFAWGALELDVNRFLRIRITGVSAADLTKYLEPLTDPDQTDPDTGEPKQVGRRKFFTDRQQMPGNLKRELEQNGYLEFTWEEVRDYIYDKVTGEPETGVVL